jgi:hypothetical protein
MQPWQPRLWPIASDKETARLCVAFGGIVQASRTRDLVRIAEQEEKSLVAVELGGGRCDSGADAKFTSGAWKRQSGV